MKNNFINKLAALAACLLFHATPARALTTVVEFTGYIGATGEPGPKPRW